MTLKRYLFLLITLMVFITTASQLMLVYWSGQHIQQEITDKSQRLSREMLEVAVEQVNIPEVQWERRVNMPDSEIIRDVLRQHKWRFAEDKNLQIISKSGSPTLQIIKLDEQGSPIGVLIIPNPLMQPHNAQNIDKQELREQLQKILGNIEQHQFTFEQDADHQVFIKNGSQQRVISLKDSGESSIDTMQNIVFMVIAVTGVVALIIGYIISRHFSRPMSDLTRGFGQLASGNLGFQSSLSGIGEMQQALTSFNNMSSRLHELTETERKFAEQQHLAELGDVSRGLAHALRNPIHTIGLSAEQLQQDNLSADLRNKFVATIQNKIKHIDKTIRALLNLSSRGIDRSHKVSILSVLQDLILELSASHSGNIRINYDAEQLNDAVILADENEIRAMLHSLLVNAIEASPAGSAIKVVCEQTDSTLSISICDNGVGIPAEVADKLFQPHISSKAEGSGMGLYIAERLARLYYQGGISLQNNEKGGATATLQLTSSAGATTHV